LWLVNACLRYLSRPDLTALFQRRPPVPTTNDTHCVVYVGKKAMGTTEQSLLVLVPMSVSTNIGGCCRLWLRTDLERDMFT